MMKEAIVYTHRGRIEKGSLGTGYVWREAYSETASDGFALYPWKTKKECQQSAKLQGKRAVFVKQ